MLSLVEAGGPFGVRCFYQVDWVGFVVKESVSSRPLLSSSFRPTVLNDAILVAATAGQSFLVVFVSDSTVAIAVLTTAGIHLSTRSEKLPVLFLIESQMVSLQSHF